MVCVFAAAAAAAAAEKPWLILSISVNIDWLCCGGGCCGGGWKVGSGGKHNTGEKKQEKTKKYSRAEWSGDDRMTQDGDIHTNL